MNIALASTISHTSAGSAYSAASSAPYATVNAAFPRAQGGGGSLARHVQHCARARGRWFGLRLVVSKFNDALSPRFFTTIVLASGFICLLVGWV